jgi:hypothetical protein
MHHFIRSTFIQLIHYFVDYSTANTKTTKKESPQSTQSGVLEEGHDLLMNHLWQAWSMI